MHTTCLAHQILPDLISLVNVFLFSMQIYGVVLFIAALSAVERTVCLPTVPSLCALCSEILKLSSRTPNSKPDVYNF